MCFDVGKGIPEQLAISAGRVHDRRHFEQFLKRGWTYLIDRAYNDYKAFDDLIQLQIFFVTRLKCSARYRVVRRNKLCRRHRKLGVISEEVVRLGERDTEMHNDLRLVTFHAEDGDVLHFLTNRLDLTAPSIANLYRARWGIELFFKFLKRTLRAARLLARSEVGVEIHVLLALPPSQVSSTGRRRVDPPAAPRACAVPASRPRATVFCLDLPASNPFGIYVYVTCATVFVNSGQYWLALHPQVAGTSQYQSPVYSRDAWLSSGIRRAGKRSKSLRGKDLRARPEPALAPCPGPNASRAPFKGRSRSRFRVWLVKKSGLSIR